MTACDDNDGEWFETVKARMLTSLDLPAVECKYHLQCYNNFTNGKNIPLQFQDSRKQEPRNANFQVGQKTL